jgi:hypothetical protein
MPNRQPEQWYEIGMVGLGVTGRNLLLNMAHLPYKKGRTYEDHVGLAGLERQGKSNGVTRGTRSSSNSRARGRLTILYSREVMPGCSKNFRPARVRETRQTHFKADIAFGPSCTAAQLMSGSSINA